MIKDFKKLLENEDDIEALYKKPIKEKIFPHAYITDKNHFTHDRYFIFTRRQRI